MKSGLAVRAGGHGQQWKKVGGTDAKEANTENEAIARLHPAVRRELLFLSTGCGGEGIDSGPVLCYDGSRPPIGRNSQALRSRALPSIGYGQSGIDKEHSLREACMDRRCAIISGGAFSPLRGIEDASYIIACDKGCEYALQSGVTPDLLVGDFDSYRGALPGNSPRLSLPVEKDDTDTMAAVKYAVEQGFGHIVLYCALGGRLDHLMGNIQAAAYAVKHGAQVEIEDAQTALYLFGGGTKTIFARPGYSLSVLSLTDACRGVSIDGAKYRLKDAVLTNTFPIGISNEWEGDAQICVESGILMVVLSKFSEEECAQRSGRRTAAEKAAAGQHRDGRHRGRQAWKKQKR